MSRYIDMGRLSRWGRNGRVGNPMSRLEALCRKSGVGISRARGGLLRWEGNGRGGGGAYGEDGHDRPGAVQ